MVALYIEWSRKASLRRGYSRKDLSDEKESALQRPGGMSIINRQRCQEEQSPFMGTRAS